MKQDALSLRDNAKHQLEKIKDLESGIDYLNKVRAIELWAKAERKDAELQNMIAEQKVRTQRILGQLLKDSEIKNNRAKGNQYSGKVENLDHTKLSDYGISKFESATFQKIASLPEEVFEGEIRRAKQESEERVELTTSRLLRAAYRVEQIERDFQEEVKTRLQGTLLNLFKYHCETNCLQRADFVRHTLAEKLTSIYEINATGGIVKIKREVTTH